MNVRTNLSSAMWETLLWPVPLLSLVLACGLLAVLAPERLVSRSTGRRIGIAALIVAIGMVVTLAITVVAEDIGFDRGPAFPSGEADDPGGPLRAVAAPGTPA